MQPTVLTRTGPLMLALLLAACGGDSNNGGAASTPTGPSTTSPSGSTNQASCSTTVANAPNLIPGAGGRYTMMLTTGAGCSWDAQVDAAWASVAPATGQGNATPVLTVEANPATTNTRSANLTIAGQVFHFSQANACTYTIDRTTIDVPNNATSFVIALTTKDGCTWTATTTETWVRVVPSSGNKSEMVTLEIAANAGDVRHSFATIAGQRVTITQQGR